MQEILHTVLDAGLSAPVKILQITDVHLLEANEDDSADLHRKMQERHAVFAREANYPPCTTNQYFEEALQYAEDHGCIPVLTGDIVDLNTAGNRAEFHRIIQGHDVMFTPGGHEFQKEYVRTMEEPYPYAEQIRPLVESFSPQFDFTFDSRVVNGLNLITIDNSLDYFSAEALRRLKAEADRGLPMLLFMHDPLDDEILTCSLPKHPNVRLTEEDYRISLETIDFIVHCPLVLAVVAGHHHCNAQRVYRGKQLLVTNGIFAGVCREILVR